jgi:flagellar motor switch protein FliM
VGEKTGRINLAIPYIMLETVLPKLSIQQWFSTFRRSVSPDTPLKVEERLLKTNVKFITELGKTQITLKDFLGLEVGDIVQINTKVTDELSIYIGDRLKFKGRPGVVGKRIAIQTTSVVKDVEDI